MPVSQVSPVRMTRLPLPVRFGHGGHGRQGDGAHSHPPHPSHQQPDPKRGPKSDSQPDPHHPHYHVHADGTPCTHDHGHDHGRHSDHHHHRHAPSDPSVARRHRSLPQRVGDLVTGLFRSVWALVTSPFRDLKHLLGIGRGQKPDHA